MNGLITGGGGKGLPGVNCRMIFPLPSADVLNVPVVRPRLLESTAMGAAYLAGLAVGYWQSTAELDAQWKPERVFEPRMSETEREVLKTMWHQAVTRSRGWALS